MRRVNGWLTLFWIVLIPVVALFGWLHNIAFVAALTVGAVFFGHRSAW
jgi:hypothetical protein